MPSESRTTILNKLSLIYRAVLNSKRNVFESLAQCLVHREYAVICSNCSLLYYTFTLAFHFIANNVLHIVGTE